MKTQTLIFLFFLAFLISCSKNINEFKEDILEKEKSSDPIGPPNLNELPIIELYSVGETNSQTSSSQPEDACIYVVTGLLFPEESPTGARRIEDLDHICTPCTLPCKGVAQEEFLVEIKYTDEHGEKVEEIATIWTLNLDCDPCTSDWRGKWK